MTKQEDGKKFAVLMAMLSTAFEKGSVGQDKVKLYFDYLQDLPIELLSKAVNELIRSRKFPSFPTIAEVREAALGGDAEAEEAALSAWSEATRLISAGRRSKDERVNDAIVLAFGSWDRFGQTNPEMEASDRKHFIACFKSIEHRRREALALNGGVEAKQLTEGGARRLREAREGGGA